MRHTYTIDEVEKYLLDIIPATAIEVHPVYVATGWQWAPRNTVPTVEDIERTLRSLVQEAFNNKVELESDLQERIDKDEGWEGGTGGLVLWISKYSPDTNFPAMYNSGFKLELDLNIPKLRLVE